MRTRREMLGYFLLTAAGSLLPSALWASKKKEQAQGQPSAPDIAGARSLRVHAASAGVLTGFAVDPSMLDLSVAASDAPTEDAYTLTVRGQASILVAENAMKWEALRPAPESFEFAQADKLVQFAELAGQKLRGHNLVWHEALPSWFSSAVTRENARAVMTRHIETVVSRYAGKIHSWDVVNEAIDGKSSRADYLRESPWLQLIGPEYLELAYKTAALADPSARLTYNDYGIELDTTEDTLKRGQVLMLVRRLKARGVPLHAVGIQSHLEATGPRPGEGLRAFIRELAKLNLEVYITELDVNDRNLEGDVAQRDEAVARVYGDYLSLVLAEPNVSSVLTWGVSDKFTWLNTFKKAKREDGRPQRSLLFDDHFRPVPAFFRMRDVFDARRAASTTRAVPSDPYAPFSVPVPSPSVPQENPAKKK